MRLFALSQITQYVLKDGYRGLALLYRLVCEILEEKRKKKFYVVCSFPEV